MEINYTIRYILDVTFFNMKSCNNNKQDSRRNDFNQIHLTGIILFWLFPCLLSLRSFNWNNKDLIIVFIPKVYSTQIKFTLPFLSMSKFLIIIR